VHFEVAGEAGSRVLAGIDDELAGAGRGDVLLPGPWRIRIQSEPAIRRSPVIATVRTAWEDAGEFV
jgi:hypothetical protein